MMTTMMASRTTRRHSSSVHARTGGVDDDVDVARVVRAPQGVGLAPNNIWAYTCEATPARARGASTRRRRSWRDMGPTDRRREWSDDE